MLDDGEAEAVYCYISDKRDQTRHNTRPVPNRSTSSFYSVDEVAKYPRLFTEA